jgi:hypothetical protein
MSTDVSEEQVTSIFSVGEYAEQETTVKAGVATCFHGGFLMEATCSSETSAGFQRTTRRYIPEDSNCSNILQKLLPLYCSRVLFTEKQLIQYDLINK